MSNMNLYQKITCYVLGMTVTTLGIMPINPVFAQENVNNEPDQPPVQNNCPLNEETPYTLGAGDRLRIDIFNVPEYSGEFAVLVDGTLNLPLVGTVSVLGLTLPQATQVLREKYRPYLKRPIVTVGLTGTRPLKIAISGEVSRPGAYIIGQGGGAFPSLTQVVQLAGGITSGADVRQVLLRRRELNCIAQVNIWNLIQNANIAEDITLRDGDAIFIPSTNTVNPQEARQIGSANIAASGQSVKVAIVGEVNRPGPYTLGAEGGNSGGSSQAVVNSKSPTVTRAIQQAGGISGLADIRKISIQRVTKTAGIQTFEVNLWQLLQTGDQNQDIFLQDGDTITIPKATNLTPEETSQLANANFSPDKITVNVVGEVNRPGPATIPPNTPLNQALLAVGGFNNRAHSGTVDLIRLNPNGTVTKRVISVNFAQGVNDKTNPIIRNNDFIIVRKSGAASVGDTLGTILSPLGNFFSLFNFFRIFQ
ncbi:MAG TPA: polysaccharide biosynthesis/export family protein [Allocoleopsis sp.]